MMNQRVRGTEASVLAALAAATAIVLVVVACGNGPRSATGAQVGPMLEVSRGCAGQNAEAEQAVDGAYVYVAWIGCGGIGFAWSADGGRSFSRPVTVPGSAGTGRYRSGLPRYGWDPAVAIGLGGTVYVCYMYERNGSVHPMVAKSTDHGRTFPLVSAVPPPRGHNWGDRDFIAVAADGAVYVTWDYGPSLTPRQANVVIQRSVDGGRTWSGIIPVSPGYPSHGGGVAAPLLVEPDGRIDVLFWTLGGGGARQPALPNGHDYFTSSANGGRSWTKPVAVQPGAGTIGNQVTWIDTALAVDATGTLYATWDTQRPRRDIGWLSYSATHGASWSPALRVPTDHISAEHIMAVAAGSPGTADVGWLSDSSGRGYALYVRPFSVRRGWLSKPLRVSRLFGNPAAWPGDTIGIGVRRAGGGHARPRLLVSWGSAVSGQVSQIWFAQVTM